MARTTARAIESLRAIGGSFLGLKQTPGRIQAQLTNLLPYRCLLFAARLVVRLPADGSAQDLLRKLLAATGRPWTRRRQLLRRPPTFGIVTTAAAACRRDVSKSPC